MKNEKLQQSMELFRFYNEEFMRKGATNAIIKTDGDPDPGTIKADVIVRMTQLYHQINAEADELTKDFRSSELKTLASEASNTEVSDPVKEEIPVNESSEEKTETVENSPEPEVYDEEAQENEEAEKNKPLSKKERKRLAREAREKVETPKEEKPEETETEVTEDVVESTTEENVEEDTVAENEIPANKRLAFDEELKKIITEGRKGKASKYKGGYQEARSLCIRMIGEFFEGSNEEQLSSVTSNNGARQKYVNELEKNMKIDGREQKLRTKELREKLVKEAIDNGAKAGQELFAEMEEKAKELAKKMRAEKEKEINVILLEMIKAGELPEDMIPEWAQEQSKDDVVESAHEEAVIEAKTELEEPEEVEEESETEEEETELEESEEEDSDEEEDAESEDEEEDEETATASSVLDEIEPEEDEEELEVANKVPIDEKTKVITPKEISDANGASTSTDVTPITADSFESIQDFTQSVEACIYEKDGVYDLHDNRDDCIVALSIAYDHPDWAKDLGKVNRTLNSIVSKYIAKKNLKAA